jgi:hypothetical protein
MNKRMTKYLKSEIEILNIFGETWPVLYKSVSQSSSEGDNTKEHDMAK